MEKLWESYGNSRNIILLHKVFHSSMKKCYEKPRRFFFCYEKPLQGSFPPWFLGHDNNTPYLYILNFLPAALYLLP